MNCGNDSVEVFVGDSATVSLDETTTVAATSLLIIVLVLESLLNDVEEAECAVSVLNLVDGTTDETSNEKPPELT